MYPLNFTFNQFNLLFNLLHSFFVLHCDAPSLCIMHQFETPHIPPSKGSSVVFRRVEGELNGVLLAIPQCFLQCSTYINTHPISCWCDSMVISKPFDTKLLSRIIANTFYLIITIGIFQNCKFNT